MKRMWLRDARKRAKLTQAQLAEIIGKPQTYISRWERGVMPSIDDAIELADALDCDVRALRFGKRDDEAAA